MLSKPWQVNQPYTVSSEYRALADVIVAMMVTPAIPAKANRHWQRFRSLDIQTWQNTVRRTTYTKVLKNFVGELVAKGNGNVDGKDPHRPVEARAGRTYDLYRKARGLYDKFRIVKDEGKDIVTTIDVQSVHQGRERRMADEYEAMEDHRADLLDYFENSNRFTEVVDPPTSLDVLLDEIEEVCGQVDKETHETHFRPGMMY